MNLRVKNSKDGSAQTLSLEASVTLSQLMDKIGTSASQSRILAGYPPKAITEMDLPLSEVGVCSGDVLIWEESKSSESSTSSSSSPPTGSLHRKEVPSDNSCLFTSVNYCLSGIMDPSKCELLRSVVAGTIMSKPGSYDAAILGKDPEDYMTWISDPNSWGGAIEAQILAEYFGIEVDVFDTQSGVLTRFGENLKPGQRALIIYDGIHYDPLYERIGQENRTLFPVEESQILERAKAFVEKEKSAKKFTDVGNFSLKCEDCGTRLVGQKDAQAHAKATGHARFGEV
eukprot:TRINITY_DN2588_c0_g1_i1.p1 TRINITY_DN2588_c0_g1~~TRINITY_DN2588_c0_g1_i1.p1  ORF type:complete len:286 (+),score=75.80 TRINITY_DN2588_c0_g1_i1:122-979(+)